MKYYEISYNGGERGCPGYLKGTLNHDWEWDEMDPDPDKFVITNQYEYHAKHSLIDFDFWDSYLVSSRFAELCNKFNLHARIVPVRMIQSNGTQAAKDYCYMLGREFKAILDRDRSEYVDDIDLETGRPAFDHYFPTVHLYEKITRFVIDEELTRGADIFRCLELSHHLVCSEAFKQEAEQQNLLGVKFVEISEQFSWKPFWA